MKKLLAEIGRVIRYSITRETKFYEIVKFTEAGILMAEDSYQIPIEEEG
ncbi:hypothetical protein CV133_gene24 [Chlorobiaceae phage CV-1-33]|nr:hypothetical protein [Chlorobiaceae bacterium]QOE32031.1 hypothetical protein CV133_gene24 [Chlorobiaceae phage CV-1-33]